MVSPSLRDLDVIAPNLKRRLSGVTATVARLVPVQARDIAIAATGPGLGRDVPHVALWKMVFLPRDRWRVWHARRNNEMLFGLILRDVFRRKLRLVFTSSSPRVRTGWTNWLISRMDGIVATTPDNAKVVTASAAIIPHGVDCAVFHPGTSAFTGLESGKWIGCLGRVRAKKGVHHFVSAMCEILPRHPGWNAVIIGRVTGQHRNFMEGLHRRIDSAGLTDRIVFHEEVGIDKAPDVYRALSLFVTPSLLEGYGLTVVEAMASGLPVVATDVGIFGTAVTPDCGHVVPKDDPGALAQAIEDVLGRDLASMGGAARDRAEKDFAIEGEAARLNAFYRDLLDIQTDQVR